MENALIWRIAIATFGAAFLGLLGFFVLAWRPVIAPIEPPSRASFPQESIAKGAILSAAGHCAACHTGPGGQAFAGGYGLNTPFGIIYGTNISPDPETGIGRWSLEAFDRAMREGVSQDGSHLFPAFPYYAFTGLSDDDVKALYAYLMTRPPLRATVPANTIPFPLSIRAFQEGWKILFFRSGRFKPDSSKSAEWNRGAYLAETLGDCGGCHTPRNSLGAEKVGDAYAGAVIHNWIAPALTDANPSPVPWTQDELFNYLRTGLGPLHGSAIAATMTPVVRDGLGAPIVPEADVRALAVYFADIDHASVHETSDEPVVKSAIATSYLGSDQEYDPDARLYASACMSCHYNSGPAPLAARPELALNSALMLPEPNNFIQAVLKGIGSKDGAPGLVMPSYASSLSDADIARLAAYLRRTRTKLPPWTDLENKVAALRRDSAAAH
jgi:mono/diheme cytochrome c family protein